MGGTGDSILIKPINKTSVHRICSGQVILDLATAVKELVENSLDAGATSIEVRLKEYGQESLEVQDNGCGVSPDNYQGLTLKYHTSKISDFSDLQSLASFGFRGEALSSLCALGNVTIETRTKHESVGTQLTYDHSGLIVLQRNIARQIGTTVTVAKLFSPLPVRYKEFSRNIRREYGRLLSLLHAYALIAKGVRLVCTNLTGRNTKTVAFKTQGNGSVKDNILTVFGSKTLACLEVLDLWVSDGCRIEGFLSRPGSGSGRASGDRQFFYVNGRPVDMPKASKLVNELYKSYNSQQHPMAILNFILPTTAYDVNVTPDKRKIFLHDEGSLMSALRDSLEKIYAPSKYTYSINNFEKDTQLRETCSPLLLSHGVDTHEPDFIGDDEALANVQGGEGSLMKEDGSNADSADLLQESSEEEALLDDMNAGDQRTDDALAETNSTGDHKIGASFLVDFTSFQCGNSDSKIATTGKQAKHSLMQAAKVVGKGSKSVSHLKGVQSKLTGFITPTKRHNEEEGTLLSEEPLLKKWMVCAEEKTSVSGKKETIKFSTLHSCSENNMDFTGNLGSKDANQCGSGSMLVSREMIIHSIEHSDQPDGGGDPVQAKEEHGGAVDDTSNSHETNYLGNNLDVSSNPLQISNPDMGTKMDETNNHGSVESKVPNSCVDDTHSRVFKFDINRCRLKSSRGLLKCDVNAYSWKGKRGRKQRRYTAATLATSSVINDGSEKEAALTAATRELERSFNKEDFRRMKVIGQFNLGFIIAKIEDDLFIIDQHASDEKFNFERLSQSTILNRQPLLRPLALELSAAEEVIISTHMDTFRRNGFDFIEDANASPGLRLLLSAVPYSKNITFGIGDVQELISILADEPASSTKEFPGCIKKSDTSNGSCTRVLSRSVPAICPSRVRTMLASRACRSSIMIGDALSKKDMEKILQHLSDLNSPWNCPHGRPTMRHLVDLSTLYQS